ncbi:MAG: hypothetical protein HOM84_06310 [Thiotrichales bacterium]|jgi:hypothetical protein|nr:hypothetical protein [Thiotrichales bacterium]MBT3613620.1 hypothetical protein [Thiotrichales bacterium]MBT3752616.1 hypothetical protein [Thiotrichales bacterium]MBT3837903.1 hypothetical protein [Thiotrichales bacterium]MBT4261604.1 hypothetical protein [Thiotrichales bacterium]
MKIEIKITKRTLMSSLLVGVLSFSSFVVMSAESWVGVAKDITTVIESSVKLHREGEKSEAKRKVIEAYFGIFESEKFEAAMRQEMGSKYTYQVERKFGALRKAMKKEVPIVEIEGIAEDIITTITKDAKKLDEVGIPINVFAVNQ